MARRFVELEEAAKMLGVNSETLNEMRERHEISAYRDGGHWKFKADDVEKLAAERGASAETEMPEPEFAELDDNLDSILLSEVEFGQSSASTSSTVIGKTNLPSPESDIEIARPKPDASDANRASDMSDVRLAAESQVLEPGPGLSAKFDDLDAFDLDVSPTESGADSGGLTKAGGSSITFDEPVSLDEGSKSLKSASEPSASERSASDSAAGSSAIDLAGDHDDDDLVLGGGSSGSDLTHAAGDSGISLVDPADSGLSLEQAPLQLAGSSVESLELGEDDMVLLEEDPDAESGAQLKADDDFLLTPLEDAGEESDSGSQVIALDSDVEFDEAAATMVGGRVPNAMLEEDTGPDFGMPAGPGAAAARADLGAVAGAQVAVAPEPPYSLWNVASLSFCLIFLLLTGMMMYDVLRNMWSWNGPYSLNSSIMDTILRWFG